MLVAVLCDILIRICRYNLSVTWLYSCDDTGCSKICLQFSQNLSQDSRFINNCHVFIDYWYWQINLNGILHYVVGLTSGINQAGVDYYNKIIDSLLEIGVEPFVTIFHMDTPLTLHFLGEWTSFSMVDYFVQYADVAFRLFGDRSLSLIYCF